MTWKINSFMAAVLAAAIALFGVGCVGAPVRIDSSTDESVQKSMQKMMAALPYARRIQLQIAIVQLNMAGVTSARQVVGNHDLENPSAVLVKDRISGKTADEIIALAARTATTRVVMPGHEPGLPPAATRRLKPGIPTTALASSRWRLTENNNDHITNTVLDLQADGSAVDEAHASSQSSWEQSADEVRVLMNQKYAFYIGVLTDDKHMSGSGGNVNGTTWTWTAERL